VRGTLPVVAIVGRPNVGKSTLFNRLLGWREAIVADRAGVTVDRLERRCSLVSRQCWLVDTGGIVEPGRAELQPWIETQVQAAIEMADCVLFVVDARAGCTPADEEIARRLRRAQARVLLVANKAENPLHRTEFFALGFGEPLAVSALHGHGLKKLRAAIEEQLPPAEEAQEEEEASISIAVLGRPNAGKSTLVNAWLGEERVIVSPVPGATRDAVDEELVHAGERIRLIDTAGLRRRSHVRDEVEVVARIKARQAVARADAAVVLLDAAQEEGVAEQDVRIVQLALEEGAAVVLAANKIDCVTRESWQRWQARLSFRLRAFSDLPLLRISAKEKQGIDRLLSEAVAAAKRNRIKISTGKLNRWLAQAQQRQGPPSFKGRPVRLKYAVQTDIRPPTIRIFANRPEGVRQEYLRYLAHSLRETFGLAGVPVRFSIVGSENPYAKKKG